MTSVYRPTNDEVDCAWAVSGRRMIVHGGGSLLPQGDPDSDTHRRIHFHAALAEISVARHLNLCWTGCGKQGIDVGNLIEVRSIVVPHYGLQVNDKDDDTFPAALVYVAPSNECKLIGWELIGRVKSMGEKKREHMPYWVLTQSKLIPIEDLGLMVA